jgi:hypothetical protein
MTIGFDYEHGIYLINVIKPNDNQVNFKAIKNK